jgi:hypothetical protein
MQATTRDRSAAISPPKLRYSAMEFSRVFWEMGSSLMLAPLLKNLPRGDGHSVMTLPGFMGADGSTAQLRRILNNIGYKAVPWNLGRNRSQSQSEGLDKFMAHRIETERLIALQIEKEFNASGRKLTLIGWSLGGLYGVALAHRYPQWIRQVITLGTPYGDPRGTAVYGVMARMNDNPQPADEASMQRWIDHTYSGGELRVPVLALYSKSDGIVDAGIAHCEADSRYVTNMAVVASHVGFPFNPLVFSVIANHMVPIDKRWAICGSSWLKPLVHTN